MHSGGLTPEEREEATKFLKEKDEQRQKSMASKANEAHEKKASVDFMNVNFEPFEDRILVYPDPVEAKTKGGLFKPDDAIAKVKPVIGTVVAVGPGKSGTTFKSKATQLNRYDQSYETKELPIKPGDRISYGNYAGTSFPIGGVEYLIMRFADCFGKVV